MTIPYLKIFEVELVIVYLARREGVWLYWKYSNTSIISEYMVRIHLCGERIVEYEFAMLDDIIIGGLYPYL